MQLVGRDVLGVLGAEEVGPVEVGVVLQRLRRAAGAVVARAAGRVAEDGVGEGEGLECLVRAFFLRGCGFVCGERWAGVKTEKNEEEEEEDEEGPRKRRKGNTRRCGESS